jgi:hypothetical protein
MADAFRKGQKVRLMDSSEDAVVTSFRKGMVTVLVDGMQLEISEKEVIRIDEEQERQLRAARVPRTGKERKTSERHDGNSHGITVDLHIEKLPGGGGISPDRALDYQLTVFRQTLRQNLRHRGLQITFIHGVGDSILSSAIRKELDERYAVSCSYTVGQPGVTKVTIH